MSRRGVSSPSTRETTLTLHEHPHTYFHLRLMTLDAISNSSQPQTQRTVQNLDDITLRQYINSALTQFLGLTGAAISVDILIIGTHDAWIRVQQQDGDAITAALSQWSSARGKGTSLRILGKANWLGALDKKKAGTPTFDSLWFE